MDLNHFVLFLRQKFYRFGFAGMILNFIRFQRRSVVIWMCWFLQFNVAIFGC